jgi:glutamate racemase
MLVPIVEEGLLDSEEARLLAHHYLDARPPLDALILGCTHYPVLKGVIREVLGPDVALVDSAEETADVVAEGLAARGLLNPRPHTGEVVHYVTGDPASYRHTSGVIGGVEGEMRLLEIERLLRARPTRVGR